MNPCPKNRRFIAWMAVDALDAKAAARLRAHLEVCPGCRGYLEEIRGVAQVLDSAAPSSEPAATAAFHQRLVGVIDAEKQRRKGVVARFIEGLSNGAVALRWGAAAVVVLLCCAIFLIRAPKYSRTEPITFAVAATKPDSELTLGNYQKVARRSCEALDDLLTRQGDTPPPSGPVLPMFRLRQLEMAEQ